MVSWNREKGCNTEEKRQIVDWYGCSPVSLTLSDLKKIRVRAFFKY